MKKLTGRRAIELIFNLDLVLGLSSLFVLIMVTFIGTIARYFFNSPFVWTEEVQVWMIVWAVFGGAGYAFRQGAHISIDVLVEKMPAKIQTAIEWFGLLCTLAALAYVFYFSLRLNIQFFETHKITSILKIPSYKILWIVPAGCIWMMLSDIYYMIEKHILKPETTEDEKENTR